MKKKLATWQLIKDSLDEDIPVMLLYVLESTGSSPGRQGFLMAVTADGKIQGSIGGGIMEHKFVEMAKEKLHDKNIRLQAGQIKKQFHNKSAATNQSGMICSGEETLFIYQVNKFDKPHISELISSLINHKNGTLELSPHGIIFREEIPVNNFSFAYTNDSDWKYTEKTGCHNHLFIIGGGHCGLALSVLMSTMDFYIHLFDDREGLFTMGQNAVVHEKKVVNDYSELTSLIPSGENNYVVVMTVGYRTDDIAIRALLGKEFKYFGILGSKAKIEKMFIDYREEGVEEGLLKNIHAPIGFPIKSETPEEIAVSIAAEIIRTKNQ